MGKTFLINFFDQSSEYKIIIGHGDDYTTDCLLDCPYFKENFKIIAIDLSKQQVLDSDAKAI